MNRSASIIARLVRSTCLSVLGAYGFFHEIQGTSDRPWLLGCCLVLMGVLPADVLDLAIQKWYGQNGNGKGGPK